MIWRHVSQIGSMKAMQTFTGPYTRRLLGELTNCGKNAVNLTGLMKRTGISRSMSYGISPDAPGDTPPQQTSE